MQLACEEVVPGLGCEYVAVGDDVATVEAAMMAHGGDAHSDLLDGSSPEEIARMKNEMESHIRDLLRVR